MKNDNVAPIVYLVDDDEAVRDALGMLFKSIGIQHEVFASALEFLQHYDTRRQSCLVADIR
ncbi:MAG TPA: DNA-binding response regulator, partial [Gammaproteobacteria bacterium]|nr:DNA-binding response regulator [Gammaproteobacteria bacterium]